MTDTDPALTAQKFLTVSYPDRNYQIVNLQLLMKNHPVSHVIRFLEALKLSYGKSLRRIISRDRTSPRINDLIAKRFRVKMAINTLKKETGKEQSL